MKKFNNYIVKTNKNYLELIKYVRDYYTRIFKYGVVPFWQSLDREKWRDGDEAASDVVKYIYGCQIPDYLNNFYVYNPSGGISLCTATTFLKGITLLGAYDGQAYSNAFDIYTFSDILNGGPNPTIDAYSINPPQEHFQFSQLNTGSEENDVIIDLNNIIEVSSRVITDRLRYLPGKKLSEVKSSYKYEFNFSKTDEELDEETSIYQVILPRIISFSVINTSGLKNSIIDYNPGYSVETDAPTETQVNYLTLDYRTKITKNFLMGNPLGELVLPNGIVIGKYRIIREAEGYVPVTPIHSSQLYIKYFDNGNIDPDSNYTNEVREIGDIVEVKDLVQFVENPKRYKEIPDILLGRNVIEMEPDCETFNPGCPFKYPSCKFKDSHCFFKLPFAYAESSTEFDQNLDAGCESNEQDEDDGFGLIKYYTANPTDTVGFINYGDGSEYSYSVDGVNWTSVQSAGFVTEISTSIQATDGYILIKSNLQNIKDAFQEGSQTLADNYICPEYKEIQPLVKVEVIRYGNWVNWLWAFAGTTITEFSVLDDAPSPVTNFSNTWANCSSLASFPQLDVSSGTDFSYAWANCSSLPHCPAGNEVTIPAGASTTNMCLGFQ